MNQHTIPTIILTKTVFSAMRMSLKVMIRDITALKRTVVELHLSPQKRDQI